MLMMIKRILKISGAYSGKIKLGIFFNLMKTISMSLILIAGSGGSGGAGSRNCGGCGYQKEKTKGNEAGRSIPAGRSRQTGADR